MRLIETSHLKTWAGSKPAESRFPYFIKLLILAVVNPEKLDMPSGDASWLPGFDGVVINQQENRFVPTGLSVWELGTDDDIKGKADDDYDKRSKENAKDEKKAAPPQKLDRSQATSVFVTPRVWRNKADWIAERKLESPWKDIWVIDGPVLQDWLESAPAVSLQFAAELGLVPEAGLQTPDQAWGEWSYLTDPPMSEEVVVAGRGEQVNEMIGHLIAPPSTFVIRGDSPREAWGFALAGMRRVQREQDRESLYARTIVADNEDTARGLLHFKNLIIVLKQPRGQVSAFLSSRGGCHVIVPEGNDSHSERNVIKLPRPMHREFAEALVRMGLTEEKAERATRESGLSVTILQRRLHSVNYEEPRWCDDKELIHLLPAVLAGRWSDRNPEDQEILRQLASAKDYASVESELRRFLGVDEPPLQNIGELWTLTAPADAFQLTAFHLTRTHLERFKVAFQNVFGRIDPKVELPLDQWIYYDVKGEKGHSAWLRRGMAETLLLIAERGADANLVYGRESSAFAQEIINGLPGLNNDWRLLASIRDEYPRLMEAAPAPFLESLERLLEAKPDDIRRLFIEGEAIFGGGAMHTGLLWGLEAMAWSPDYLPRIALLLAELAILDPGGRMLNRPINSLREIFLWWHPGTNASIERRLAAIDLILERHPDIGWDLLVKLLPNLLHSVSTGTEKPRWRDFGDMPDDSRTRGGQVRYISAIIDRALTRVQNDPERWRVLLKSMNAFSMSQQEKVVDLLTSAARGSTAPAVKSALWQVLRDFTHQHKMFQDARWALPKDLVNRLEAILPHLAPADPVERNRWLFDEWLPELSSANQDPEQQERRTAELRQQAVKEVFTSLGVAGLVKLGTTCKLPGFVAIMAVPLMADLSAVRAFIEQAIREGDRGLFLASHISAGAQELYGESWRNLVRENGKNGTWPPDVIAALLLGWPDERATWEDAISLGVEEEYWRKKPILPFRGTPEEQAYKIDRLIQVGRSAEAFNPVGYLGKEVPTGTLAQLFDATFDELYRMITSEEVERAGLNSNYIREFLNELRRRKDLPRDELMKREYRALQALGPHEAQGLALHEYMAAHPDFFVDVICDAFLPHNRNKADQVEPTAEERARGEAAYTLLNGMVQIPGQRENNEIDEETLVQWVYAVRKRAAESDRAIITDQQIGQILAHSPEDPEDKGWPHRAVRNVIEKFAADHIDRGFMIGRFNMRGVYSKAMYEGGDQERALASQYRGWADISRSRWPRMAQVLETMANDWEKQAQREDEQAEQEKLEDSA